LLQNVFHHQPRTNDAALALLHEAAPDVDWDDVLRGWIFPGPYSRFKPDDVPQFQPG